LVCAQVPYEAAEVKIFPRSFLRLNRHGMPAFGLFVSSIVMEGFLIMVMVADDVYMAALVITGVMILPAYLSGGMYLFKLTLHPERLGLQDRKHVMRYRVISALCVLYCMWMIYAGGIELFMFSSIFYLAGIGFYLKARRERRAEGTLRFTSADVITSILLAIGVIASAILMAKGQLPF
ncbi:MAG: arginine:ornithine antiporter, partial [Muribaculaceae bacterium]|nr:arginine:ornithine antiporter [Muribaculaceae bacterium]